MTGSSSSDPIVFEGASVFYGEVVGLSQVDMVCRPGITGIVGPNGSGKTTMMRALTGLLTPAEGSIRVLGGSPFDNAEIRRHISIVPATECFFESLSGRRNLEISFLAHGYDRKKARQLADRGLELVGLTKEGRKRYGAMSRGMRQRLKLGVTLAGESEIVLLDEPFLGIDPPSRKHLRTYIEQLAALGKTVLVSSHVLHEVETLTDLFGVLANGRLLGFGRIDEILFDLRDRHPHRIRLKAEKSRRLAAVLLERTEVSEVKVIDGDLLEFVTERPEKTYQDLPGVVVQTGFVIHSLTSLDNSLEAVFRHMTEAGSRRL